MSYQYLDPDYTYTDPKTGLLRNLAGIENHELLIAFESLNVARRLEELEQKPIKIKVAKNLSDVHKYLFQDVYAWAGIIRAVEISKEGKQFFPTHRFDTAFAYVDTLIAEYRKIKQTDIEKLSHKLAEILDTVNFLHPFREGNGRTQREFLRTLALEKNFVLNLNPPDNRDVYNLYMSGTINGDVEQLSKLIFELLS
jgi:cell filamentation protein